MANFLGIVKSIGKDLGVVGTFASPVVSIFNPALGAIIGRVSSAVVNAEAQIPEEGQGPAKAQMVAQDFNQGLSMAQALLKQAGQTMTYDPALLEKAISDQAVSFNSYAALARSIKITPTSPASAVAVG